MLSDYIPVYFPGHNKWSIPTNEVEKYEDYIPEPQELGLYEGAVIKGIPLIHFGTWGAFGVNITEVIRSLAKDPEGYARKSYKDKGTAADVAKFFKALVEKYPGLVEVEGYRDDDLSVPADCIVSRPKPRRRMHP